MTDSIHIVLQHIQDLLQVISKEETSWEDREKAAQTAISLLVRLHASFAQSRVIESIKGKSYDSLYLPPTRP